MKPTLWILLLAGTAGVVPAQQAERNVFIHRKDAGEAVTFDERVPGPGMGPVAIQFMTSEMSGRPVKGAPYSGKGVTETTQVLADGNRIHRTSGGMLYRDSEGRTRREQSLARPGSAGAGGGDADGVHHGSGGRHQLHARPAAAHGA